MELSVIIPTLNDRERLLSCLDAVTTETPRSTEIIVVNGPSSDGTTGAVRNRDDVDVLVELSERNRSVLRNAGIEVGTGDVVALLDSGVRVTTGWYDGLKATMGVGTDVVTGPRKGDGKTVRTEPPVRHIGDRTIPTLVSNNVAFDHSVLEALDGFDERVGVGGISDCAHRLAAMDFAVTWSGDVAVEANRSDQSAEPDRDWGQYYRSTSYMLTKNYGPRPSILGWIVAESLRDGWVGVRGVLRRQVTLTNWFGIGTSVFRNIVSGVVAGIRARYRDRSPRRNPYGVSSRHDRAVQRYDWR